MNGKTVKTEADQMRDNLREIVKEAHAKFLPRLQAMNTDMPAIGTGTYNNKSMHAKLQLCPDGEMIATSDCEPGKIYTFGQSVMQNAIDIYTDPNCMTARIIILTWQDSLYPSMSESVRTLEAEHEQIFDFNAKYRYGP